ncbi:PfaD family polyunsaturated fatty acid/polyketide biosynthesis protein [Tsukamurella sp. 8F]|uniref:PfaD family polyunsaturated fatty acid/polyketide biosynthesis protein n=1 Tax=unclassified Tsukamurella TaxID=2633480 RepID=UPI0023B9D398|nr:MULTISPECIES: PfaD family polyunsaturated fatty acid/polyketide biosynthesis protein [unclassified Tsukamurella]MDF0529506.1 PfaD family polyunsaturated fatty acid/polyketide biosynthesis protein [Tsukamurella sp. 8J]MDF0585806.1 PfaD family polyunsaturated fatty acid/polyketide biosynthesis protein [Tsukamurella sp. 8F]
MSGGLDIRTSMPGRIAARADEIRSVVMDLERPCWIVRGPSGVGATHEPPAGAQVLAAAPPISPLSLGEGSFRSFHGVAAAYAAGAMANGIASVPLVTRMARSGYLASYGAAGVVPDRVDAALAELAARLGTKPFACNLIHSPTEPALERAIVDSCLRHEVRCVEASAFMSLTPQVLRYRLAGLEAGGSGVVRRNRLIAKVSRAEVAELFLRPAPIDMVRRLVEVGDVTAEQAELAATIPVADDVTAEADSGGHTDRRPLVVLLPELIAVRDRIAQEFPAARAVRIGAAGGLGTPVAAAAAFAMGAAYIVTGSVNQASVEADQSDATKRLLAAADVADTVMTASSDMFEMGVQVQVLRRGTMFATRAQRLYEVYRAYDGLEALPADLRDDIERTILGRSFDSVWDECIRYFSERDPAQLTGAESDPKRRMALVFRWYLGLSSGWSMRGDPGRITDYQIWCGPAMGAFNRWAAGSDLESVADRHVDEIADRLMHGAAIATRVMTLRAAGVRLPSSCTEFGPIPLRRAAR